MSWKHSPEQMVRSALVMVKTKGFVPVVNLQPGLKMSSYAKSSSDRAKDSSGVLCLCFGIGSISRHQPIRAHSVEHRRLLCQGNHLLHCANARRIRGLSTEAGLLRFNGVRAVPWQPPAGQQLPDSQVWLLLAARCGTLWIGPTNGLASWKDSKLV